MPIQEALPLDASSRMQHGQQIARKLSHWYFTSVAPCITMYGCIAQLCDAAKQRGKDAANRRITVACGWRAASMLCHGLQLNRYQD